MSEDEKKENEKDDVAESEEEPAPADDDAAEAEGDDAEAEGDEAEAEDDEAEDDEAEDDEAEAAPAPAPAAGHDGHGDDEHKSHVRGYMKVFVVLIVLTALEVGIVYVPMAKGLLISALVGLAIAKAAIVALYYMHLNGETNYMKWSVAFPVVFPAVYAVVLIMEGMYRALWGEG